MKTQAVIFTLAGALVAGCLSPMSGPEGAGGLDAGTSGDPAVGGGDQYHPEGYAQPAVHGTEMKLQAQDCRTCHGAALEGQGAATGCDSCHQQGWRTNCTYCHGGQADQTGAPPNDLDPSKATMSFPAHTAHVRGRITGSSQCLQCHKSADDVLSVDHAFDATPGRAEVEFGFGLARVTTYTAIGCSNNYCHGNGQENGSIGLNQTRLSCNACHAANTDGLGEWLGMGGAHAGHLINPGMDCTDCHGATTAVVPTVVSNKASHVNGRVDLTFSQNSISYDPNTKRCQGFCHLFPHPNLRW